MATIIIDRHLTEDVVHEAFLDLWQHPDRYNPNRADLQSWLRTLAHRRAIDRIRSLEASRNRNLRIGIRDHYSTDHTSDQFDALFTRGRLRAALAALTDKQRDAILLRSVPPWGPRRPEFETASSPSGHSSTQSPRQPDDEKNRRPHCARAGAPYCTPLRVGPAG